MTSLTIALAGNPNAGKTTIFNAITGARQHVGNYPGVTVERKEGVARRGEAELHIIDLPGTYSLSAYSDEEVVARDVLLRERPDVVIDIVDCSNLERNLYLTTQLLEIGVPLVLAFNMMDLAAQAGCHINVSELSQLLGVPIVPTVGSTGEGIDELLATAVEVARQGAAAARGQRRCDYGGEVEPHVAQLTNIISSIEQLQDHDRWYALQLLEDDDRTSRQLTELYPRHVGELLQFARQIRRHLERIHGQPADIVLTQRRYGFVAGACAETVRQSLSSRRSFSDRIDRLATHPWLGLPIFAVAITLAFQATFWIGNPIMRVLDGWKELLAAAVRGLWPHQPGLALLRSLLADGIIEGVGAVLVFVPLVFMLYLMIAILEDSGYMARAAFVLDRLMHRIGLHGKSFIPLLIGFGCTVPAIMSTRILESRRDRLTTMLVLPLMSCGARLPVYVLILGAFFLPRAVLKLTLGGATIVEVTNQALLLLAMYALGIVLAIICAKVLRATVLKGENAAFVMELPPYRLPTAKGLAIHVCERTWQYARKAGTIILAIVIVLWALKTWPQLPQPQKEAFDGRRAALMAGPVAAAGPRAEALRIDMDEHRAALMHSAVGRIGQAVAPVLRPCGFDWKVATALMGASAAKEAFISQMGVIYGVGDHVEAGGPSLQSRLAADYTPLQALCMMVFILIASPCMATVAVTARESGSWKWAALQWAYLTVLAWAVTAGVYQAGSALRLGTG